MIFWGRLMAGGMPHDHAKRQYREAARVWGRCDGFVAKHMGDGVLVFPTLRPDRWTRHPWSIDLVAAIASGLLLMGFACALAALWIH